MFVRFLIHVHLQQKEPGKLDWRLLKGPEQEITPNDEDDDFG